MNFHPLLGPRKANNLDSEVRQRKPSRREQRDHITRPLCRPLPVCDECSNEATCADSWPEENHWHCSPRAGAPVCTHNGRPGPQAHAESRLRDWLTGSLLPSTAWLAVGIPQDRAQCTARQGGTLTGGCQTTVEVSVCFTPAGGQGRKWRGTVLVQNPHGYQWGWWA